MLSILCVRLTIKVKVGTPESFKVGWYLPQKTGSSHLKFSHFIPQVSLFFVEKRKPNIFGFRNVIVRRIRKVLPFVIRLNCI